MLSACCMKTFKMFYRLNSQNTPFPFESLNRCKEKLRLRLLFVPINVISRWFVKFENCLNFFKVCFKIYRMFIKNIYPKIGL